VRHLLRTSTYEVLPVRFDFNDLPENADQTQLLDIKNVPHSRPRWFIVNKCKFTIKDISKIGHSFAKLKIPFVKRPTGINGDVENEKPSSMSQPLHSSNPSYSNFPAELVLSIANPPSQKIGSGSGL
jgi:hypothetical protein